MSSMQPRVLILRAAGINRDEDAAAAVALAGGVPERIHVNRVVAGDVRLLDYAMVVVPGGFSYGDHLGGGKLLAVDLAYRLGEQLAAFVAQRRPVLGICNGFQVLVKAGILPQLQRAHGASTLPETRSEPIATLTDNLSDRFECRWVQLATTPTSSCIFTQGVTHALEVPIAHGEGRFVTGDPAVITALRDGGQIALRYVVPGADPLEYPANPNGSDDAIAGVCNAEGNVLGLMPHPENAILPWQHPNWTREPARAEGDGLILFKNAITYANGM